MKGTKLLLALFLGFCFFSCQENESLYSCDPVIERWAAKNSAEISKLDRKQFLKLSNNSVKRAAYRVFDTERKQMIWKEKYQELKKLNWSVPEWEHISLIYSLILDDKKSIFASKDLANDDELLLFIYRWQEHAHKMLGWNKKQIYAICYSVEKVINKEGDLDLYFENDIMTLAPSEGSGFECSCSQKSSYCDILDHEGPAYTSCRTPSGGSCVQTSGCGLFWAFDCDGMCLGLHA